MYQYVEMERKLQQAIDAVGEREGYEISRSSFFYVDISFSLYGEG
jgi:hypothetical protein